VLEELIMIRVIACYGHVRGRQHVNHTQWLPEQRRLK
jgi:hypothetical protein